jgi:predicted O-linked N-acetylglucosamine transferase (SPINDLY family)
VRGIELYNDRAELMAIRRKLEETRDAHPLFDTDFFRRHLESAYLTMWDRHLRGEKLISFVVEP